MATINFTNYADSVYGYNYGGINTFNLLKEKTISTGATPARNRLRRRRRRHHLR